MSDNPGADDFAARLAEEARDRQGPAVRPRDAATLIVIDRSGPAPKVLMGRRHPDHKFMPGKYVFPGGRIEPGDRQMVVAGALSEACEMRLMKRVQRPSYARARSLALAAIRETFEETGLMYGSKDYGPPERAPDGTWSAFAEAGVFPELDQLTFIARAITPPGRPKRFDARFFAIDHSALAHQVDGVVSATSELDALVWVTFAETKAFDLPVVTRVVIEELATRIARGFGAHMPAPFFHERRGAWLREEL